MVLRRVDLKRLQRGWKWNTEEERACQVLCNYTDGHDYTHLSNLILKGIHGPLYRYVHLCILYGCVPKVSIPWKMRRSRSRGWRLKVMAR